MNPQIKLIVTSMLLLFGSLTQGQQFMVTQQNSGGCLYSLENTGAVPTSAFFYLFGDGFYGIKTVESRSYPNSLNNGAGGNTPYEASSFKLDPYNINPPAKSVANTNNIPPTCGFIEPSVTLNTNPQIGASWAVSPVSYNYMIIKARRTRESRNSPLPSHLNFYYKSSELVLDGNILYENDYKNWFTTPSQSNVNINGFDKLISLPFDSGVGEDELVIAYVPLKSLKSPMYEVTTAAELYSGVFVQQAFQVQGTPHDPNEMQVDKDCFFSDGTYTLAELSNAPTQRLNYKVIFRNQGNAAATNVVLKVKSDRKWDLSTVEITGSKHPCTLTIDPSNDDLIISFFNIGLPGSNQGPVQLTYDETQGWVQFRVCTKPFNTIEIWQNSCYVAHTDIYFDHLSPISTNTVTTGVECNVYCFSPDMLHNPDLLVENEPCDEPDGRTKMAEAEVKINPTLANDIIEIMSNQKILNVNIKIITLDGRTVFETKKAQIFGSEKMDISQLNAGLYLVRLSGLGTEHTWKIVKM